MSDDQDYSQLAVEDKIKHNIWKVRLDGYTTLINQFENSRNDADSCFGIFSSRPECLKDVVLDSNVVAQESGVLLVCKYLEFGCPGGIINKLKTTGIVGALCEKGLASSRAGTKAKSVDAVLLLAEVSGCGDWIVEQIVPYFENRLPKLVAGCVHAIFQLISYFGCALVPPKLIIPALAKLFAHADRNVRAETTKLTVELYIWLQDGLINLLFDSLKPVQQKDLTAEFGKVADAKPEQKRLTRAQKEELALRQQQEEQAGAASDVVMLDTSEANIVPVFDPFDMMEPVEVLSKLPKDLYSMATSAKWKERVEALEAVQAVFKKAPKLVNDDYTELVRLFAKCFKDVNIQVVQLAANGVEALCLGLKEKSQRYRPLVLTPIIERSKEKKPAVADALANALDAIFMNCSLQDVLEEVLLGMKHKTPQVRISSTNFLQRCLVKSPVAPKGAQIDAIMQVGVKLLADSQEPIRQAATEMVGTLIKITGERELRAFFEKVDENRVAKIKAVYENVTVNVSVKPAKVKSITPPITAPTSIKKPDLVPRQGQSSSPLISTPILKKPAPSQSIPSKRLATSPAKRDLNSRMPMKSLAARSLLPPSTNGPVATMKPKIEVPSIPAATLEELRILKEENRRLKEESDLAAQASAALVDELRKQKQENALLAENNELLHRDNTNGSLMVKQKDTQIMRLTSDLENAKLKIKSLEQSIEMMELQSSKMQAEALQSHNRDAFASPFTPPSQFGPSGTLQTELSSGVNRLSIEGASQRHANSGDAQDNVQNQQVSHGLARTSSSNPTHYSSGITTENTGDGEENWRKATEVTAQLKARIEKMKQRNRLANR